MINFQGSFSYLKVCGQPGRSESLLDPFYPTCRWVDMYALINKNVSYLLMLIETEDESKKMAD